MQVLVKISKDSYQLEFRPYIYWGGVTLVGQIWVHVLVEISKDESESAQKASAFDNFAQINFGQICISSFGKRKDSY
jgi:hypothetical protein